MKLQRPESYKTPDALLGAIISMDLDKRYPERVSDNNEAVYDQIIQTIPRNRLLQNDGEKWRPFWQRGQTTYEEMKEMTRARQSVSRKTRLHHSNMDLTSDGVERKRAKTDLCKSVSVHGLNRAYSNDRNARDIRNAGNLSKNNSQLVLPLLEPDVDVLERRSSRANSHMSARSSLHSALSGPGDGMQLEDPNVSDEEDLYESDDDPVIARQNLDKAGDYIVEHDWVLKGKIAKEAHRVKILHHSVEIVLPDDDPLEPIKSRMDEINMMVKPRAEYGNFLDTIDPEQKATIMKYKFIDSREIRAKRMANWKPIDRFRDAVNKVLMQYRASYPRRRYINDDEAKSDGVRKLRKVKSLESDPLRKSSLGHEMQLALATQPMYRSEDEIKRVTQILRATKAFKHLFPAQLEAQVAKVVAYERYDDKRIIAQQGRIADRFYYLLTGKVDKVREYRLMSGIVTRVEGCIEKGNTTDPQEMTQNWLREQDLVAKGHVEVLILDKKDFNSLLHTCEGPPIEFLQRLDLFKEFPCEVFRDSPEAIDFRYYGKSTIVVKDSNRTPWLHVVKTGHVKVVRMQTVIDTHNEDRFSNQTRDQLGCVRPFSHASAMLGVLAKQRKQKSALAISFPEVIQRPVFERSKTDYNWTEKTRATNINKNNKFENPLAKTYRSALIIPNNVTNTSSTPDSARPKSKPKTNTSSTPEVTDGAIASESPRFRKSTSRLTNIKEDSEPVVTEKKNDTPKLTITSPTLRPSSKSVSLRTDTNSRTEELPRKTSISFLPPIGSERRNSDFVPHGTYLTREKTEVEPPYTKRPKKETVLRETYLQLDILKPGDIFGLEHMEPQALASEGPGVTLISDGAEIIKISKRFFLHHAKNNTMLKVETMQREYMSEEEAKTVMFDQETWRQYKSVLLDRTVENLHRTQTEQ